MLLKRFITFAYFDYNYSYLALSVILLSYLSHGCCTFGKYLKAFFSAKAFSSLVRESFLLGAWLMFSDLFLKSGNTSGIPLEMEFLNSDIK